MAFGPCLLHGVSLGFAQEKAQRSPVSTNSSQQHYLSHIHAQVKDWTLILDPLALQEDTLAPSPPCDVDSAHNFSGLGFLMEK